MLSEYGSSKYILLAKQLNTESMFFIINRRVFANMKTRKIVGFRIIS